MPQLCNETTAGLAYWGRTDNGEMDRRPNITLKQLEALYWSAALGSFALAAERLAMTQSALSKRIMELEQEIGSPLFDRSGSRARITDVGERLIPLAEQMLNLCDEIMIAARGETNLRGICRFGISQLMALTFLPDIVSKVRATYPDVVLEPRVAVTQELIDDVLRGETDFALGPGQSSDPVVVSLPLTKAELVWVSSPALASEIRIINAETLQRYPVISMSAQAATTTMLSKWATSKDLDFKRIVVSNSPEAVAALTISGLGISLLSKPLAERFVASGQLSILPVADDMKMPDLEYFLHWRADNSRLLSKAIRDLALSTCRDEGASPGSR